MIALIFLARFAISGSQREDEHCYPEWERMDTTEQHCFKAFIDASNMKSAERAEDFCNNVLPMQIVGAKATLATIDR